LNALLEGGFGTEGEDGAGDELSGSVAEEPVTED
jgi:hypothetical protein